MRLKSLWLLIGLWLCLAIPGLTRPIQGPHVEAELVSAMDALIPGQTQLLALRLKMDPKWHVYWRNPGAAGYPPKLEWTLPKGFKAGAIQWPTPEKSKIGGLWAFVYEGEVFLPVALDIPKEGLPAKVLLKAHVRWLACSEACVPGEGDLELELPVAAAAKPTTWQKAIDDARNQVPLAQGLSPLSLSRGPEDKLTLAFAVATEGNVEGAQFYPYEAGTILDDAAQPFQAQGNGGSLQLTPEVDKEKPTPLNALQGQLVVTQGGKKIPFDVNVTVGAAPSPLPRGASPSPSAAPSKVPAPPAEVPITLVSALIGAFIGGLILNLMPCVFPVLSLKIMGLVQHNDPEHKPHLHGLAFTGGVLACFWLVSGSLLLLRASGQKLGWGFQLQSPPFVALMACLFFLISLNLFGLFEVGEGLVQYGAYADKKTGYSESFWSGALATLVATPCSAPFMGAAVGYALTQPAWLSLLIFTFLGLGMACPYVLLTSFPALLRFLPRPGVWMETFKQLMAFPMLATVVWFVYVLGAQTGTEGMAMAMMAFVFLGMAGWMLGRWGWDPDSEAIRKRARYSSLALGLLTIGLFLSGLNGLAPAKASDRPAGGAEGITWETFSPARVEEARRQGKAVFVDFTADWCLSCKVNERVALRNEGVQARFREMKVVAFKGDWTNRDAVISETLASFGRSGVPFYLYYPKGKEAVVLPELITPQIVLEHLSKD